MKKLELYFPRFSTRFNVFHDREQCRLAPISKSFTSLDYRPILLVVLIECGYFTYFRVVTYAEI